MDKLIQKAQEKSLSNSELLCLIKDKANLITYPMLKGATSIDSIMKHGACIILYLTAPHYGHWVCVFYRKNRKGQKIIEFFDSYGYQPDQEKQWLDVDTENELGMGPNYLSRLLSKSKYEIEYNHHKFQKGGKNNAVCGRWVALRLNMRHLTLEEFHKLFDINKPIKITGDWLVTALTLFGC